MPKRSLAEFFLARAVGPTRAASISGDLLEIAATRGRLWYYTTYIRTLVALTWRTPAAFLLACVAFTILYKFNILFQYPWPRGVFEPHHAYIVKTLIYVTFQLWFLAPFAVVKYGSRDRLAQFTFGTTLILTCAYHYLGVPGFRLVFVIFVLLTMAALLLSVQWRGPLIALTATAAVGVVTLLNLQNLAHLYCWVYEHKALNATTHYHYFETGYAFDHPTFWIVTWIIAILNMLVLSFVYSRLHQRLSRPTSRQSQIA
jgi:hypothetical protein